MHLIVQNMKAHHTNKATWVYSYNKYKKAGSKIIDSKDDEYGYEIKNFVGN